MHQMDENNKNVLAMIMENNEILDIPYKLARIEGEVHDWNMVEIQACLFKNLKSGKKSFNFFKLVPDFQ